MENTQKYLSCLFWGQTLKFMRVEEYMDFTCSTRSILRKARQNGESFQSHEYKLAHLLAERALRDEKIAVTT